MNQKTKSRYMTLFATACLAMLSATGPTADESSSIRILQNNLLEVKGQKMILFGIVIPTATDKCESSDKQWPCGASATLRLSSIFKSSPFSCVRLEKSENLPLARCSNSQFDIAEQLVLEGWAITVADNLEYVSQERDAKEQQVGIWRDGYSPPAHWRTYPNLEFNFIEDLQCSACAVRKQ